MASAMSAAVSHPGNGLYSTSGFSLPDSLGDSPRPLWGNGQVEDTPPAHVIAAKTRNASSDESGGGIP